MSRPPVALVFCFLAAVTAVALVGAGLALTIPAPITSRLDPTGEQSAVVRRFYAAVDEVLRTGDPTVLDAVVDPGLVEHAMPAPLPPTRAGLVRYVLAVRAAFPQARLVVEGVVVQADAAAARVRVEGVDVDSPFVGPMSGQSVWGSVDLFRLDGDRVVEHWGALTAPALPEPLVHVGLDVRPPATHTLLLQRETYPVGAGRRVRSAFGSRLLCVEEGAFTVLVDEQSPTSAIIVTAALTVGRRTAAAPGDEARVADGDCVLFPEDAVATVVNVGNASATALRVEIVAVGSMGTDAGSFPTAGGLEDDVPGAGLIATRFLAGSSRAAVPVGVATLTVARLTLAPGETVSRTAPGPVLVAVEEGQLGLAVDGSAAWSSGGSPGNTRAGAETRLGVGEGALIPFGAHATFRNPGAEPLVVLALVIAPSVEDGDDRER